MNYEIRRLFQQAGPPPTSPKEVPFVHHGLGGEREDAFHWLSDPDSEETMQFLSSENEYYKKVLFPLQAIQETVFGEIKARTKETDLSVAVPKGPYEYYARTQEGSQYPIHCRRLKGSHAKEQVLLDENQLAEGKEYLALGVSSVSPNHQLLAYSVDFNGSEVFELRIEDLAHPGEVLEVVPSTYYGAAWSEGSDFLFYTRTDDSMRPYQILRHRLGTSAAEDILIFQEDDERFFLDISKTSDERYLVIDVQSKTTTEQWTIPANEPEAKASLFAPRREGIEFSLDHHDSGFFVITNEGREDFRLAFIPEDLDPSEGIWEDYCEFAPEERLEGIEVFKTHLAVLLRRNGLLQLRLIDLRSGQATTLRQPEEIGTIWPSVNAEYDTEKFRYDYTSFLTPHSIFEVDLQSYEPVLLKIQEVLGEYDPALYDSYRIWARSKDGTDVPVSIVHKKGLALDGNNPALLYGYGAYEHSVDPAFSVSRLSLLERGFVFAIAHVRGGGELGRRWYEEGKLAYKPNTFYDFVACARALIDNGLTSPELLVGRGGSAGGLLIGAVANMAPDLFGGLVAEVPFVDCLTTISTPDLPLTITEWEEWGNPLEDIEIYQIMESYSPYDNVHEAQYPALYVTAGLNDPRVSYWEPAKWVARLRKVSPDAKVILHTELGSGHMGPTGRYEAWRDEANVLSFVLAAAGSEPMLRQ